MNKYFRFSLPLLWLIFAIGLTLVIRHLEYNNDHWISDTNPHQQAKKLLSKEFESSAEQLLITIKLNDNFFTPTLTQRLNVLSDEIRKLDAVLQINSPLEATVIIADDDYLQIQSYRSAVEKGLIADYDAYQKLLTQSKYYGLLISRDYQIIALSVTIDSLDQLEIRTKTVEQINALLENYQDLGDIALAGDVQLKNALNLATSAELSKLLWLVTLILTGFLFLLFGKFWRIGLLLGTATLCVLTALSVIVLAGHYLTIISLALPIMIIVIAIADCIHILGYWDNVRTQEPNNPHIVKATIAYSWRPCLNTSLTTAIGFASFAISDILSLRNFGRDAAIAIMLSYLIMLATMASGLSFVQHKNNPKNTSNSLPNFGDKLKAFSVNLNLQLQKFLTALINVITKRGRVIIVSSVILFIGFGFSLTYARTETNLLDVFFPKQSDVYRAFTLIDKNLGGSGSIDIIFTSPEENYFHTYPPLLQTIALEAEIKKLPWVSDVQSYLLPLREAHVKLADDDSLIANTAEELGQALFFLGLSRSDRNQDVLAPYLDFNAQKIRIKIQLPNLSSTTLKNLLTQLDDVLMQSLLPSPTVTGHSTFFQVLSQYVVNTQFISITFAFLAIFGLLWVQFGKLFGVLGSLTTALPVVITLGTISLIGFPFDFATVIIASIAMGISVDDNIHILHCYHHHCQKSHHQALKSALLIPGKPVLQTSLLFVLGIGVFTFSDLVLLKRFGIFTAEAIILAWFSSTLLLPALLDKFSPYNSTKKNNAT